MKQYKSIIGLSDKILELTIQDETEMWLVSPSNTYVVFDGTASILCEGTFPECYVYRETFKKHNDYDVTIYSREGYDKMMEQILETMGSDKTYKSFWDYTDTLDKESDKFRDAMTIATKYHSEGKNPDNYLDEIINEVNKRNK